MKRFDLRDVVPTVLLVTFLLVTQIANVVYFAYGLEESPASVFLRLFFFFGLAGYWLERDCKKHKIKPIIDTGLLLYLAWPIVIPYQLIKTRGLKGLLTILAIIGVFFATYFFALIVYFALL